MNYRREDSTLHTAGICNGYCGYKEWFHYETEVYVEDDLLTMVLGGVASHPACGCLGWLSFRGTQYSLAGNPADPAHKGFFTLNTHAVIHPYPHRYTMTFSSETESTGSVEGTYPSYVLSLLAPHIDLQVGMKIQTLEQSIASRTLSPWMSGGWFHSGDVAVTLEGTISGKSVSSHDDRNRGWYERNWSTLPVFWPSEWFFLMIHLDNGAVLDLYRITSLRIPVHFFDECWIYSQQAFTPFTSYRVHIPSSLYNAIRKKDYSSIFKNTITAQGTDALSDNSFSFQAHITDFRHYAVQKYYAHIGWSNFCIRTTGEATVQGAPMDMSGRGIAELCSVKYWWL
jgi:hypothetical protein